MKVSDRTMANIGKRTYSGVKCKNCETDYAQCTHLVFAQGKPCCVACGRTDTHETMEMARAKVEPPAEFREMAKTTYAMYVALTDEGFNEKQALTIIGAMLANGDGEEE